MSVSKIVKRYANRKLYDTERSCYVTLDDIATMVKQGDTVQVVDNRSGTDLTSVTFAQIVFELEKKNNFIPLHDLRSLICEGQAQFLRAANDSAEHHYQGVAQSEKPHLHSVVHAASASEQVE
jgi:polyhydroxyalkanoate synthesis repressor PhaR